MIIKHPFSLGFLIFSSSQRGLSSLKSSLWSAVSSYQSWAKGCWRWAYCSGEVGGKELFHGLTSDSFLILSSPDLLALLRLLSRPSELHKHAAAEGDNGRAFRGCNITFSCNLGQTACKQMLSLKHLPESQNLGCAGIGTHGSVTSLI